MTKSQTATIVVDKLTRNYYISKGPTRCNGEYRTFRGAVKSAGLKGYTVSNPSVDPMIEFLFNDKRTKIVTNPLSGRLARIPVNTPLCGDPSSETYHSM